MPSRHAIPFVAFDYPCVIHVGIIVSNNIGQRGLLMSPFEFPPAAAPVSLLRRTALPPAEKLVCELRQLTNHEVRIPHGLAPDVVVLLLLKMKSRVARV
jgi:hypothetical protein